MFRPDIPPAVEKSKMIARCEVINCVAQFAERHVQEQQDGRHIIDCDDSMAGRHQQIEHRHQLEGGDECVGDVVVGIGEGLQILGEGASQQKDVAAGGGDGQQAREDVVYLVGPRYPAVEEREEGEHEHQQTEEDADVEQDAGGVGRQVQVGRLLVLRHHRRGVGVDHPFLRVAAFLRQVVGLAEFDDLEEKHKKTAETDGCRCNRQILHYTHNE